MKSGFICVRLYVKQYCYFENMSSVMHAGFLC